MLQIGVAFDEKQLRKMDEEVEPKLAEALRQNAENILWMAKALCPVKTGNLRASLHIEQTGEFEYMVGDGVPYGIFVEKGHRTRAGTFVEPQPFLGPAVDRMRPRCEKRIKEAIMTAKERAAVEAEADIKRGQQRLREMLGGKRMFGSIGEARERVKAMRRMRGK